MRRLLLLPALFLLAGCGSDAEDVLADTAANVGEIRSGTLDMALLVAPREGGEFGFELHGPFELARSGGLPRMRIDYTQIAGGNRGSVTLVSTGEEAWAESAGERIELSPEQVEELRSATRSFGGRGGGFALPLDDWIEDADVSDGPAGTDKVEGELDIVATVNGLLELVRALGRDLRPLAGTQAERLRDATEEARFELFTGKDDRLLRHLLMEAEFGLDVPRDLRAALGNAVGGRVTFRLDVAEPNQPVRIAG